MRPEYNEFYDEMDDSCDADPVCRCGQVISPFTDKEDPATHDLLCDDCYEHVQREERLQRQEALPVFLKVM